MISSWFAKFYNFCPPVHTVEEVDLPLPLPLYVGQAPTHRIVLVLQVTAPVGLPLLVQHDVLLPVVGGLALQLHPQGQDSLDELLLGAAVVLLALLLPLLLLLHPEEVEGRLPDLLLLAFSLLGGDFQKGPLFVILADSTSI